MNLAACISPTLTSNRLTLRPAQLADAPAIFERYAQDAEVTRYLAWRPHRALAETEAFLRECEAGWHTEERLAWVILLAKNSRECGEVIGMIDLSSVAADATAHLGYVLGRPWWNRGFATEAAAAVIGAALRGCSALEHIRSYCYPANTASRQVLTKLGMEEIALVRDAMPLPNLGVHRFEGLLFIGERERLLATAHAGSSAPP